MVAVSFVAWKIEDRILVFWGCFAVITSDAVCRLASEGGVIAEQVVPQELGPGVLFLVPVLGCSALPLIP